MASSTRFILWEEDDENDAFLVARAFQKAQAADKLIRVRNGVEVVEYLQGHGCYADRSKYPLPSLLLLDVKMPMKNGLEVLEWTRAQPQFQNLPAVVFSSSAADCDLQTAERLGARAYCIKPCNGSDLTGFVRQLVESPM